MEYSSIKLTKIYDMQEELEFKKAYLEISGIFKYLDTWFLYERGICFCKG